MTDLFLTRFERNTNKSYIIYSSILIVVLAILYFHKFLFVIFVFSYGLGCLACYYGLSSSILNQYVEQFRSRIESKSEDNVKFIISKACITCGSKDCSRHDEGPPPNPWTGLQVHKQLDQAVEDFYNTILEQFVSSWYGKITVQPFFVDELKHQLRYASACLLQRALKINYSHLIMDELIPCGLLHYSQCAGVDYRDKIVPHPAVANRLAEMKYLRCVTEKIMPYLLNKGEVDNPVFHVLIRELFAGWVLLSITDVLADPYILNTLIVLATGDETMANLPNTPNYKVEFLETFVRQTDSVYTQRSKLFKLDLDLVINDQDYFYAFMQYMKGNNQIQLLQFYKDIKSFQTKILNPELSKSELQHLCSEAQELNERYELTENSGLLNETLSKELGELLQNCDNVKKLQTSPALYEAARQSHSVLEKIMLPKFLHSEEFYNLLIGSRLQTGFQKQMLKKPQERLIQTALKLGSKLKGALKSQSADGQLLESIPNADLSDAECLENMDILKYLESIAAEESLRDQDLSAYKVVLTNVETRLAGPPRRGSVRVFTLAVHVPLAGAASLWTLERSEHDFHLLRTKLTEFHSFAHNQLQLPSRRDNSPLETIRYKYEDFLQRLLQERLLQTSELLHIFLTVDGDFSTLVQASTLSGNNTDLANFYQSVTHKLRKEKGQHLESFLRNFLVSSDMDRYQALKQGTREVDEAYEVNEDIELELFHRPHHARNILNTVFGNNWDIQDESVVVMGSKKMQVQGLVGCVMYLLIKVINARYFVIAVLGSIFTVVKDLVDQFFYQTLDRQLKDLLTERRLAHLIKLGQGLLFGKKSTTRVDPQTQCELARRQLTGSIPGAATAVLGPGLPHAVNNVFDVIQDPLLNKQLVYNLLDLCLAELFPELRDTSDAEVHLKA